MYDGYGCFHFPSIYSLSPYATTAFLLPEASHCDKVLPSFLQKKVKELLNDKHSIFDELATTKSLLSEKDLEFSLIARDAETVRKALAEKVRLLNFLPYLSSFLRKYNNWVDFCCRVASS